MGKDQLVDLEEVIKQSLVAADFHAAAAVHDQLRPDFWSVFESDASRLTIGTRPIRGALSENPGPQ